MDEKEIFCTLQKSITIFVDCEQSRVILPCEPVLQIAEWVLQEVLLTAHFLLPWLVKPSQLSSSGRRYTLLSACWHCSWSFLASSAASSVLYLPHWWSLSLASLLLLLGFSGSWCPLG